MTDALIQSLRSQGERITDWLAQLGDEDFAKSSALDGWDLRLLTAHLVLVFEGAARRLEQPVDETPLPAWQYVRLYRPQAEQIGAATTDIAGERSPAELVAALTTALDRLPDDVP